MNLDKRQKRLKEKQIRWQREKEIVIQEQDLNEDIINTLERKQPPKEERKKVSMTKKLMIFLFVSCSAIEVFTMYAILKSMNMGFGVDFTPLTTLITSVVAEVISFSIYSLKSMKENTQGGIVYETALLSQQSEGLIYNSFPEENENEENYNTKESVG